MILVSLRDSKAETWTLPKWTHNKATALREFGALVNDSQPTLLVTAPGDYDLYQVGEAADVFDGKIVPCTPVHLANGVDVKRPSSAPIAPME